MFRPVCIASIQPPADAVFLANQCCNLATLLAKREPRTEISFGQHEWHLVRARKDPLEKEPIPLTFTSAPSRRVCVTPTIEQASDNSDPRSGMTFRRRREAIWNPIGKTWREANDFTLEFQSRHETLPINEYDENNLRQLLVYISCWNRRLREPPAFNAESNSSACANEAKMKPRASSAPRLRHWLDRSLPKTKSPQHAPMQTSD